MNNSIKIDRNPLPLEVFFSKIGKDITYERIDGFGTFFFDDNSIWNSVQKSHFIEGILFAGISPTIYTQRNPDGSQSVLKGHNICTALQDFFEGKFSLKNVSSFLDLEDVSFETLDAILYNKLMSTIINVVSCDDSNSKEEQGYFSNYVANFL